MTVAQAAAELIMAEPFGADVGLADEVVMELSARLADHLEQRCSCRWTRDGVIAMANAAAEDILETPRFEVEYSVTIRDRSLVDLTVNAIGSLLDHPGMGLDDIMRENWNAEEPYGDAAEMVREWLA